MSSLLLFAALAAAPSHFHGLSQADGVTFTATPDNCALSILYDNFGLRPPLPGKPPALSTTRRLSFTTVGRPVAMLALRGAALTPANAPATIVIVEGGRTTVLKPKPGENYELSYTLRTRGYLTPVAITLRVPTMTPDTLVQLDSIDAAIGKCKGTSPD